MKLIHILLINFLIGFTITTSSQTTGLLWENYSQVKGMDFYSDVLEDKNEGYTVLGSRNIKDNSLDFWLIRFNENGDMLWTKTLGTENKDIPKKIIQLTDKSYILMGTSEKENSINLFLIRTDEKGNEQWRKIFDNNEYLTAEDLIVLDDEKFAIAGANVSNQESTNPWIATMNAEGEFIWEKTFESISGSFKSIKKLPAGGFAITGNVSKAGEKECDIIVLRTDETGEITWSSRIKTPGQKAWPECICCSPDSCFNIVGWQGKCLNDINSEYPVFDFDLVLNKIDCNGNVLWTKSFDKEGSEGGNAITIRPDGSFIVAGVKVTSFLGKIGPWLLHIDADGNFINEKLLDMHLYSASKVINCSDGGFIVIGPGNYKDLNYRSNGWIIKFASF